ncbi:hypothetical protein CLAIMM_10201 [Cladophialophora immunda]|nr:hypothetical protein CLAIMM_10201 [Cladophialophora immunda]
MIMHGHDESYGHDGGEGEGEGEGDDSYDYADQQGDDGQGMAAGAVGNDHDAASLIQLVVKLLLDPQPGPSHVPKPQHAHSRFAQDPRHAESMRLLDKIASEPIHEAHLESMIHVGLLLLARMAKKVGMTAGHEAQGPDAGEDGGHGEDQAHGHGEDETHGHGEDECC